MLNGHGDSPQYALDHLDPDRIRMARERMGLTGREVADKVGKSPGAISQFESGTTLPDLDTLVRLSMALQVPTTFFAKRRALRGALTIPFDGCHFRARRSATQRDRRSSVRQGELLLELVSILERKGVEFPKERISTYRALRPALMGNEVEAIEQAASGLRRHWGLGLGPIPNLVQLLESKGIFVFPLADTHMDVDAYSVWAHGRPCVMLALNKGGSRARFDGGHELAHLALHEDIDPGASTVERQADRFAGAFLAPRETFLAECPRSWSLQVFQRLKVRWRMSIAALVRRAYDLECLSQSSYSRAFRDLSMDGMRTKEPEDWKPEAPTLLSQALGLLKGRVSLASLADELTVYPHELEALLRVNVREDVRQALKTQPKRELAPVLTLRSDLEEDEEGV